MPSNLKPTFATRHPRMAVFATSAIDDGLNRNLLALSIGGIIGALIGGTAIAAAIGSAGGLALGWAGHAYITTNTAQETVSDQ